MPYSAGTRSASLKFINPGLPSLGPASATFLATAPAGSPIASLTGLASSEVFTGISPNDGRVALSIDGTKLLTGATATAAGGSTTYSLTTSLGRTLSVAISTPVPSVSLDFVNGLYVAGGSATTVASCLSVSNTVNTWVESSTGLVQFASGGPRITDKGLRCEQAKTNLLAYGTDPTNAQWTGTKTVLSGTFGPFPRVQCASTGALNSGLLNNNMSTGSLTAGVPYGFTVYYEAGTSGKIFIRIQQNASPYGPVYISGTISALGVVFTGASAGTVTDLTTKQLTSTNWKTSFTFTPNATCAHTLSVGPFSTTSGQTLILNGAQVEQGAPSSIIPQTTAGTVRSADAVTAIGALATALEAASGTAVLEVSDVSGFPGNILSGGSGDAVQMLTALGFGDVASIVSGKTLQVASGGIDLSTGTSTLVFSWAPATGRQAVWNSGARAIDATVLPTHTTVHLFGGAQGTLRRLTVYPAVIEVPNKIATSGWQTMPLGAGGYLVGLDIAPDGTKLARADVYGGYLFNDATQTWTQLISTTSMPAADIDLNKGLGCLELIVCPTNTSRFYAIWNGYLYRTDTRGAAWARTAYPQLGTSDANANQTYRLCGKKMAVDPQNANIVLTGHPVAGLSISKDGGATWTAIATASVPLPIAVTAGSVTAGNSGYGIAFDRSSTVTGGATQGIYVFSHGNGVYYSGDGGTTWTLTPSGPTNLWRMICAQDGTVYSVAGLFDSTVKLYKYSGGAWTTITASASGKAPWAVAVDPTNANNVVVVGGNSSGGALSFSSDHATTFTGYPTYFGRKATDIPWLEWTNEYLLGPSDIMFDPLSGNLIMAEGIGVWKTSAPFGAPQTTWQSMSLGIEELVTNFTLSPPGGAPLFCVWDRAIFRKPNIDGFTRTHGPNNVNTIEHCWDADYASADPTFIVMVANNYSINPLSDVSSYSTDGGKTWTGFPGKPSQVTSNNGAGGCIACASSTNMIWAPAGISGYGCGLYYTKDGGTTWNLSSVPGVPTTGTSSAPTGWDSAVYFKRQFLAADRVNVGTFYAYNYIYGLFKSTDGGATFAKIFTGEIIPGSGYNAKIKIVPATASNMFFLTGVAPASISTPVGYVVKRSMDGVTWTTIPNVLDFIDIAFGKPLAGSTVAYAVYAVGFVNNVWGYWRSDDDCVSWKSLGQFANNSLDTISHIGAHYDVPGRMFVGFQGSGFARYDA